MLNDTASRPPANHFLKIGVTGSRELHDSAIVNRALWELYRDYERQHRLYFIVGCCVGVDEFVARWCLHQGVEVFGVIPPDQSRVMDDIPGLCDSFDFITPGPDGYKRRNQRIVDLSDVLIAFPQYPEDHPQSRRSGTWQTIRMGRRKGIIVDTDIHVLNGGV